MRWFHGLIVLLACSCPALAQPATLVTATTLGGAGDDRIEGVAIGDDGSIYLAGHLAAPPPPGPGVPAPLMIGRPVADSPYGCAFIARLSPDGRRILALAQLAAGVGALTTVEVNSHGVYAAGYATRGLEPALASLGGLLPVKPGPDRPPGPYTPPEHAERSNPQPDKSLPGVPIVLRFSHDLARLEHGTFLEGFHTVWHVPRPLNESRWQPTGLALLSDANQGDLVVCHDAGPLAPPPADAAPGLHEFYRCPDHLSRLSADLSQRRWKKDLYHAPVVPERASRATKMPYPYDTLGNTRSLRLRVDHRDGGDRLYLAGWAASRTMNEPWWNPFLWRLDPADGRVVWGAYSFDPMSGGGERLGGLVSDAAIRSVNTDDQGNVLLSGIGDGGNNVLRFDPRDYTAPAPALRGSVSNFQGRTLFFGMIGRLDPDSRQLTGGQHLGGFASKRYQPAWADDLCALPGRRILAVGRHRLGFAAPDALGLPPAGDGAGAFLRIYDEPFEQLLSVSLPDADLVTLARRGTRVVAVGATWSAKAPTNAALGLVGDGRDGYIVVIDAEDVK